MRKYVLVRERDGAYEMQPSAQPEDSERVVWGAGHVEHLEGLTYWGECRRPIAYTSGWRHSPTWW
jgi:hypothetical protein